MSDLVFWQLSLKFQFRSENRVTGFLNILANLCYVLAYFCDVLAYILDVQLNRVCKYMLGNLCFYYNLVFHPLIYSNYVHM